MVLALSVVAGACAGSDSSAESNGSTGETTLSTSDTAASDVTSPTAEATTTEPATTEPEIEPFRLIEAGPYAVGVASIQIVDEARDRPLTVDVWFPLAPGTTGDLNQYTLLPGVYYESPEAISAEPFSLAPDGPFPLVMYSHGSGGLRYIHSSYTEAIASHGYIVMAPDHTGNTAVERLLDSSDSTDLIAANRPLDISAVIDAALDANHPTAGAFTASIDAENIAATGHSFGGYTAYALASGVTVAGVEIAPDTRIDALIALAPATGETLLTDEQLASISIPSMIIVGTDDKTTPIDPNVERPWGLSPASPHYRVELLAAEHQTFTDLCEYQAFMPSLDEVPDSILATIEEMAVEGCLPDDMPTERASDLTNTLAIGFLDAVLRGEPAFDPSRIELPGDITVEVK